MSKTFVDEMIRNMKQANIVAKATPWIFEGVMDKKMNVRYVGITLQEDWLDIFSQHDNLLIKFLIDRSVSTIEFYIANKPPFTKIITRQFNEGDKWETLFGEVKRRLKRDKSDYINHNEQVGNIYTRILPTLKK